MKNEILDSANEYLLKSECISYPINIKTLKDLYNEQEFLLLSYSEAKEIIREYSLPVSSVKYAFMYVSNDHKLKCVLYRDGLMDSDIIFCAAYFLGKMVLEKIQSGIFPIILDAKFNFQNIDSAAKFAIEILAPTSLLKHKNIHTIIQIKHFTHLSNKYCLQILKNLHSEQKSEYSSDVARMLSTKIRPQTNSIIFYTIIICLIATFGIIFLSQNTNIFSKPHSEESLWYVDTNNVYHKYNDCDTVKKEVFIKGPIRKSADDIANECPSCKSRRLSE